MLPKSPRAAAVFSVITVLALAAAACGGGTPKPKDEGDDTASSAKKGDDSTSSAPADSAAAAPADSSPPPATPPPASTAAATGDIKAPAADDPWMASHQMTPKDVMKATRPATAKVKACFKAGVKRDGSTNGEVKIRFVITNDGAVRVWRDDGSSMTDGDVTKCVGEVINKLKFPKQKSPGDAWGSYAINFTP